MQSFSPKKLGMKAMIIALIITALFAWLFFGGSIKVTSGRFSSSSGSMLPMQPDNNIRDTFGGFFYEPSIDQSLPYYQYKKIADSIDQIKKEQQEKNDAPISDGMFLGKIGVAVITEHSFPEIARKFEKDPLAIQLQTDLGNTRRQKNTTHDSKTVSMLQKKADSLDQERSSLFQQFYHKDQENNKSFFISLEGYTANYDTKFYVSRGKYYIIDIKQDTSRAAENNAANAGHYISREIPVRYARSDKKILIPVTDKAYRIARIGLIIAVCIFVFGSALLFIVLPIQLITNISRGRAFSEKNIRTVFLFAYWIFLLFLGKVFGPLLLHFLFRKKIPDDFHPEPFLNTLFPNLYLLIAALAMFALAKAFKKGYQLQLDQQFTV